MLLNSISLEEHNKKYEQKFEVRYSGAIEIGSPDLNSHLKAFLLRKTSNSFEDSNNSSELEDKVILNNNNNNNNNINRVYNKDDNNNDNMNSDKLDLSNEKINLIIDDNEQIDKEYKDEISTEQISPYIRNSEIIPPVKNLISLQKLNRKNEYNLKNNNFNNESPAPKSLRKRKKTKKLMHKSSLKLNYESNFDNNNTNNMHNKILKLLGKEKPLTIEDHIKNLRKYARTLKRRKHKIYKRKTSFTKAEVIGEKNIQIKKARRKSLQEGLDLNFNNFELKIKKQVSHKSITKFKFNKEKILSPKRKERNYEDNIEKNDFKKDTKYPNKEELNININLDVNINQKCGNYKAIKPTNKNLKKRRSCILINKFMNVFNDETTNKYLPEILESSFKKVHKNSKFQKHKKDAKRGESPTRSPNRSPKKNGKLVLDKEKSKGDFTNSNYRSKNLSNINSLRFKDQSTKNIRTNFKNTLGNLKLY